MTRRDTCTSCARDTETVVGYPGRWQERPIRLTRAGLCAACVESRAEAHADDVAAVAAGRRAAARLALTRKKGPTS